jgi:uncharacterized protein YoaH (UPF0181 family)
MSNQTEELRYWPRLGLYVTRADAEEYIAKAGGAGAVLDETIEEFTPASSSSPEVLRSELDRLFEAPFTEGEMTQENKAILAAISMEQDRVPRIKELMQEGMTKEEAKAQFDSEMDEFIRETLGLPSQTEAEREYQEKYEAIHGGEEE